jgi:hypothetical protein
MMTVKELIEDLLLLPPDAPVASDGCDCVGVVTGAEMSGKYAIILRKNGSGYPASEAFEDEE